MEFELTHARLRPLRMEDAESLARHADDTVLVRDLPDHFPHPYTVEDAEKFLDKIGTSEPLTVFAIEVDGECAGTIGWKPKIDVERFSVEIGYWVGTACAGRGITTEALQVVVPWLIRERGLTRVEAKVFQRNRASARVLEKAGFVREGLLRRSAVKHDEVIDQELWAFVVDAPGELPVDGGTGSPW